LPISEFIKTIQQIIEAIHQTGDEVSHPNPPPDASASPR
jgi:hypothetical protein